MTHIYGSDRTQMLLLPEAVDEYVSADNPVRFIDAFVNGLDLAAAGFGRVQPKATGQAGFFLTDRGRFNSGMPKFISAAINYFRKEDETRRQRQAEI